MWSFLAAACGSATPPAGNRSLARGKAEDCSAELVSVESIRGVIFTDVCSPALARAIEYAAAEKVTGYFRPTEATIQALEHALRPALERGRANPELVYLLSPDAETRAEESWGVRSALTEILAHFTHYRRQYVGIVTRSGARRVLVSSFPEVEPNSSDDYAYWTARWVDGNVDDGGPEFWRIQYDVSSGRFLGFDCNPSA